MLSFIFVVSLTDSEAGYMVTLEFEYWLAPATLEDYISASCAIMLSAVAFSRRHH